MTGRAEFIDAFRADERGASMALVALSLVWIVGMASLVIDIGDGWLTRQSLIPATDAGALAAAQDLVDQPTNHTQACATAATFVLGNAANGAMTSCDVTNEPDGGRVTVTAAQDFDPQLTEVGQEIEIESISTATWGPPLTVSALRPIAFCYDGDPVLQQLLDNPPTGPTSVIIAYLKDDPSACGGPDVLGKFVTVDFETSSSRSEIEDWMTNGYGGQLGFDELTTTDCSGAAVCYERAYASAYIGSELRDLQYSGQYVPFPVFNYADVDEVHLVGIIRARIDDFDLSQASGPANWFMELTIDPGMVSGTCCGTPSLLSDNKVVAICGVDSGDFEACEPEAGP